MKKIIAFCAAAMLLLSGCTSNNGETSDGSSITESAPSTPAESGNNASDMTTMEFVRAIG